MENKLNVIDKYQSLSCEELKEVYVNEMNDDVVLCLNLTGEWNIGCIIRTASLFQMGKVVIVGAKYYDKRTTVGMHHYIPIQKINSTPESNPHVKQLEISKVKQILEEYQKTHQVIFVEHGGFNSREIHQHVKKEKPVLFVLGSENEGIPSELLKLENTQIVSIQQKGICRSFNVSNAFAMIAYEYYN